MKLDVCAAPEAMLLFALPSYYQQKEVHEKSRDSGQAHSRKRRLLHVVRAWCAPGERQERWLRSAPSLSCFTSYSFALSVLPCTARGLGLLTSKPFCGTQPTLDFIFSLSLLSLNTHTEHPDPHILIMKYILKLLTSYLMS